MLPRLQAWVFLQRSLSVACSWLLIACLIFATLLQTSETKASTFPMTDFRRGWVLFQLGRYQEAAQLWQTQAREILHAESGELLDAEQFRQAGFAEVLITLALEQADNASAYQHWSNAVRYYLQGNTRWDGEQERLKKYYEDKVTALSLGSAESGTLGVGGGSSIVNDDALMFLELEKKLDLSNYHGPRSGLKVLALTDQVAKPVDEEKTSDERSPPVIRGYLSRPGVYLNSQPNGINDARGEQQTVRAVLPARSGSLTFGAGEKLDVYTDTGPTSVTVSSGQNKVSVTDNVDDSSDIQSSKSAQLTPVVLPRGIASIDTIKRQRQSEADKSRSADVAIRGMELRGVSHVDLSLIDTYYDELQHAKTAWRYFANNTQDATGLYNSAEGYRYTGLWSMASSFAAIVCANKLGVIDDKEAKLRLNKGLSTLAALPFYRDELPNREYDTHTGEMVDLHHEVSSKGSGWSAMSIGRLLVWLKIIATWYPDQKTLIRSFVDRLDTQRLQANKQLNGAILIGENERTFQEGRLGYEQYAAMGFRLWEIEVPEPFSYSYVKMQELNGIMIPVDTRQSSYLTSEAFMLSALELSGISARYSGYIDAIYQVQKSRADDVGYWVAFSEDALDRAPWFVYNSLYANDEPWQTVTFSGDAVPRYRHRSVKAAFAWHGVYNDAYTQSYYPTVSQLHSEKSGYYSGIYSDQTVVKALSANTNAVILESLLYRIRGQKSFLPQLTDTH